MTHQVTSSSATKAADRRTGSHLPSSGMHLQYRRVYALPRVFFDLLTFRTPPRQCRTRTWHLHLIFLTLALLV